MKKYILLFSFFGCITIPLTAQSNIVALGGNATGSGGSVSYSVGQIDYAVKSGGGGIITEGLQQPFEITVVTGVNEPGIDLKAVVFPNPASDYIELHIDDLNTQDLNYTLFDVNGSVIEQNPVLSNVTTINLSPLVGGIYFLTVSESDQVLKTFKVSTTN